MPTATLQHADSIVGGILILLSGVNGAFEGTFQVTNLDYIMDTIQTHPHQLLYQINTLRTVLRRSMRAHRRHMNTESFGEPTLQLNNLYQIGPSARQWHMHRRALRHPIFYLD